MHCQQQEEPSCASAATVTFHHPLTCTLVCTPSKSPASCMVQLAAVVYREGRVPPITVHLVQMSGSEEGTITPCPELPPARRNRMAAALGV